MDNFYNLTSTELSSAVIVFNILFALILLAVVIWIYKKTHKGLSYSPSFIFTLIMIGLLGSVVMMVVRNNIVGAFALLGAFSIIRFRTILKETRDIAFVFFALVIGVSAGTNNYSLAMITTAIVGSIILLLHNYKFDSMNGNLGYILSFNSRDELNLEKIKTVLEKGTNSFEILQTRSSGEGSVMYIFSIQLKEGLDSISLVNDLSKNQNIENVEIITGEHTVEY